MAFNFVSEGHPYNSNVYAWNNRQLALWRDFLRAHVHRLDGLLPSDVPNGGFYLYEISRRPQPDHRPLHYLPGNKPLRYFIHEPYATRGDNLQCALRAVSMMARFPDVLLFRHEAGLFFAAAGEWQKGYIYLLDCVNAGMMGEATYIYLAKCAIKLGQPDEAISYLQEARRLHLDQEDEIDKLLAEAHVWKARESFKLRQTDEALAFGLAALTYSPKNQAAMVLVGDIYRMRREWHLALAKYEEILTLPKVLGPLTEHVRRCILLCREMKDSGAMPSLGTLPVH